MDQQKDSTRFNTVAKPNWCPGCGNFGIHTALKKAMLQLELDPHQVTMVSGIGCSGKIVHWLNLYGMHSLHGRTLPIATGIKLTNKDLIVIAEGGDGDGYSEGMNHFVQAARRNVNLTYIVHNNGVFSLTKGQSSSTGEQGFVSMTTPHGAIEPPHNPIVLAIAGGATFVARGYSGDQKQLSNLIVSAIKHPGFALIDVMQVCVTYNPSKSYKWYMNRIYKLEEEGHDPTKKEKAIALACSNKKDRLATGVFYKSEQKPYDDMLPQIQKENLVHQNINNIDINTLKMAFV